VERVIHSNCLGLPLACAACTGDSGPVETDPFHAHVFEQIRIPMRDGEALAVEATPSVVLVASTLTLTVAP